MTAAPEPLRLFTETTSEANYPSPIETKQPAPDEPLRALARSVDLLRQAESRFDGAVRYAREHGHSWRAIGSVTGVPYQSLHRRFRERAKGDKHPYSE